MTIKNTFAAESWEAVYTAFEQVNFTAYDYETVKASLIEYIKIYHPEKFNDWIESSPLVAIIESFAYVAELLSYRVDMLSHENFISTAQRKQSILRLAKLISYTASRNLPARGLAKITSVSTSETIVDSIGNNLSGVRISWNDSNNDNWKEQFFLVMGELMTSRFGQPQKSYQVNDVLFQSYNLKNDLQSLRNGVSAFLSIGTGESFQMEAVPVDLDENGPFERAPDINSTFSVCYASDGRGDGSDYTGFMTFLKQGTLVRTEYTFTEQISNRRIELDLTNINDTDVWVYRINNSGAIEEIWHQVDTLNEQNLVFNSDLSTRKKFEVESLENDRIALIFGDGNFSDIPFGRFQIWTRTSENRDIVVPKNGVVDQVLQFSYRSKTGSLETAVITFSLVSSLQNNAQSEDIERIRQVAPSTHYSQNRMVNGQDYNTYMLKDSSILKLSTINRTFAGQSKYLEWNDASGKYQNIKLFGDDLQLQYNLTVNSITSKSSTRAIIDKELSPLLQKSEIFNLLNHISALHPKGYGIISVPRTVFIENNRKFYKDGERITNDDQTNVWTAGSYTVEGTPVPGDGTLNEKTAIQGALDRHYYGDPLSIVFINGEQHGLINDPILHPEDDGKLYLENLKRTIDGINTFPPGDIGSGIQPVSAPNWFGLKWNRFLSAIGTGQITLHSYNPVTNPTGILPIGVLQKREFPETFTIEIQSDGITFSVISNIRGRLPDGIVGVRWSVSNENAPIDFTIIPPTSQEIETGGRPFEAGDGFVIDLIDENSESPNLPPKWYAQIRDFSSQPTKKSIHGVNFNGWWEVIRNPDLPQNPSGLDVINFDPWDDVKSWVFIISKNINSLGDVLDTTIYWRSLALSAKSPTTKFWYNNTVQIIDSETKKPVRDKIRILRSNLDSEDRKILTEHVYDVVGAVYNQLGEIDTSQLSIIPSQTVEKNGVGDIRTDNLLQFEDFSAGSYEYVLVDEAGQEVDGLVYCGDATGYDVASYDSSTYDSASVNIDGFVFNFDGGCFLSNNENGAGQRAYRKRIYPGACNVGGLDFMWQHWSPNTNLIDPSPSNIHDAFILTRGYYESAMEWVRGESSEQPVAPSPLELKNSYGYLLDNKMISDTVVLHSGKIKFLFGALAEPQLRAKFRVVKAPNSTISDERIKSEIISVINLYFNINDWNFGETFYATKLMALIDQRLGSQISSAVIVPMYSNNLFGSLFTIECGFDEILQSAATIDDVEIVDALTPTVLRQLR